MRSLLLILALAAAPTAELEFEEVLAKVETLMEVGRWSPAKRLLLEEVAKRQDDPRVVAHLADVRELLERCSFGSSYRPTRPQDVVGGELVAYRPARGEVHLRYRPGHDGKAPGDYLEPGPGEEVWLHPLAWNGPFTIRVRGRSLPETLSVIACTDEAGGYVVQADAFLALLRVAGEGDAQLQGQPVAVDPAQPFELEVRVNTRDLQVSYNGARKLSCAKPGNVFGFTGFTGFRGVESIELEGRAELSWIQSRIDDDAALARLEHEDRYSARDDLPAWLAAHDLSDEPDREEHLFDGFEGADPDVLERARDLYEWEDHEGGLSFAESLNDERADERLRSWMRSLFLVRLGRHVEALEALDRNLALDRGHLPARRAHAILLWKQRDRRDGLQASRALIADFPSRPEPYEDLARTLLRNGKAHEVRDVLQQAASSGVRSRDLQFIERILARAARGPQWPRTHETTSRNYVVRSDISRELCLEAGQVLDGVHRMFEMRLGRIEGRDGERLPVYLFSGQGGYLLYTRELLGALPVHTAGVYSPAMQQLLIWNLPEKAEMLRTVRHEGFHQFLDRRVGAAPTWLHEGLAEYFAESRLERGRWAHGGEIAHHLSELRSDDFRWTPLERLLHMPSEAFYSEGARYYAEAWHWVHFLENSSVQNGRRVRALVDALASGQSEPAALETAFPARELAELDRARRAHLPAP